MKRPEFFAIALFVACAFASPARAGGPDWLPVDPAQLTATTPAVEKTADAEAIFWDVRVEDQETSSLFRTVLSHYIRVKIYTDHGKETQSQIDLPYYGRTQITDIAGRTIKPDGSIVLLKPDAVFDRTIVKVAGDKLNAKSFAMPAVERGCIIEYRWKEIRNDAVANYIRLQFQRDIPVQRVTYHIKPLNSPYFPYGMRSRTFHLDNTPFAKEDGGFYATTATNIPAFREEPHMPAEDIVRPWMLIFYSEDDKLEPQKYWQETGKRLSNAFKGLMKVNDDIKKASVQILGDAATPDEKLERIYDFCRTQIKNVDDDASGLTDEQIDALKENKNPWDTLARKQGTDGDINLLFASLATAAGFEAHVALMASHADMAFDPAVADTYFLRLVCTAVKVGDGWRFCDPSEMYLPYGMLNWKGEGQQAFITDPKSSVFVQTPTTPPEKSVETRTATFTLSEDGTLEGDVQCEYTGQVGAERKEYNDDDSPEQREQTVRDALKEQMSTAEVADVKIENVQDPVKPLRVAYHVRIPGYAQRTGKRIFLQPAVLEHNRPAVFSAPDRRYLIEFRYPWTEIDDVTISLPKGYVLDNADAPQPFSAGPVGAYDVKLSVAKDGSLLKLHRKFFFGGGGTLLFIATNYPNVKLVFDTVHESDNHSITLKQQAGSN